MADASFETWLNGKLNSLGLDEEVYLDYLKGVLEEGEDAEETKEILFDILSGVLEENVSEVVDEIVQSWVNFTKSSQTKQVEVVDKLNVESLRIKDIIEQQQSKVVQTGKNKLVDSEFKKKLLEQYAAVSDEERDEDNDDSSSNAKSVPPANTNTHSVIEEERVKREKAKKESDDKKVRDKLNREKDKQKRDERQEKEKKRTQKGERRR